ncbi:MAG: DUF5317 family protein [Acidimicrobiales bacterium]
MLIFPLALGSGVVAGYAGGGRLHGLGLLRLRAHLLLFGAVATQLALPAVSDDLRFPMVTLSYAMVGGWLLVNVGHRATILRVALGLLAVGWMLNAATIAANGGMPVSMEAFHAAGGPAEGLDAAAIDKHVVSGPGTRLAALGDVIPVPPLGAVVSVGDIAMVVGIMLTVAAAMASVRTTGPRRVLREEAI